MTKEEREVMEMALDALEDWNFTMRPRPDEDIITAMKKCLANDALEKKAENARELGLMPYDGGDYEPDQTVKIANDIAIGVDVTKDGTHVIAMRLRPDGVKVVMYSQFHPLAQQNEFKPDWDEKLALTEEVIRLSKRIEEMEAQPEQHQDWCASLTRMLTSMPPKRAPCNCKPKPEQEPRNIRERWNIDFDGDDLLVCFNDHEKSEGCRYERYVPATTTPPQRKPLTDEEIDRIWGSHTFIQATDRRQQAFARAIEAAHGIKE